MIAWHVNRLHRTPSTMDAIDAEGRNGAGEGLVVVADEQTAGRGRGDRPWVASPGSSLLCSILLRPATTVDRLGMLPLIVGLAVAEAIEAVSGADCRLKWPNDVWIGGEKVAGVLVKSRLRPGGAIDFVNLGIGVNVSTERHQLPEYATSIRLATGVAVDRDVLLTALLGRLERRYASFVSGRGNTDLDAWRQRAALVGEDVVVVQAGETIAGKLLGIDDDGALLIATPAGDRRGRRRGPDAGAATSRRLSDCGGIGHGWPSGGYRGGGFRRHHRLHNLLPGQQTVPYTPPGTLPNPALTSCPG